jgi:hypothetical protein
MSAAIDEEGSSPAHAKVGDASKPCSPEDDLDSDQLWAAFDTWQPVGSDEYDASAG